MTHGQPGQVYLSPQDPGAPGVGDLVVVVDRVLAGRIVRVCKKTKSKHPYFPWHVAYTAHMHPTVVSAVRRPTPDELAAYLLAQGPAGPEGQP